MVLGLCMVCYCFCICIVWDLLVFVFRAFMYSSIVRLYSTLCSLWILKCSINKCCLLLLCVLAYFGVRLVQHTMTWIHFHQTIIPLIIFFYLLYDIWLLWWPMMITMHITLQKHLEHGVRGTSDIACGDDITFQTIIGKGVISLEKNTLHDNQQNKNSHHRLKNSRYELPYVSPASLEGGDMSGCPRE